MARTRTGASGNFHHVEPLRISISAQLPLDDAPSKGVIQNMVRLLVRCETRSRFACWIEIPEFRHRFFATTAPLLIGLLGRCNNRLLL